MSILSELLQQWHHRFGQDNPAVIVRAPGRVNIIGEHTDYNEGFVLPGAMTKSVYILASIQPPGTQLSDSPGVNVNRWVSDDFKEEIEFEGAFPVNAPLWCSYVQGAIDVFSTHLLSLSHTHALALSPSYTFMIGGDLPIGAGVSSSSSLVCGVLYSLQQLHGSNLTKEQIADLGSLVEREIIGLQGGIMDQYAIMLSQRDKVMILDCRDRSYRFYQAAIPGTHWLLINTKVKHQLIDSDYNQRANECKRAVSALREMYPQIHSLRDVTISILEEANLPVILNKRARFVIEENARVEKMVIALSKKDAILAGVLLKESHLGLQYQYEVSCDELDHLAEIANNIPGVYGGRMMGGGFGGCVICLVKDEAKDAFLEKSTSSYERRFGFKPEVIEFELDSGVEVIHG